MNIIDVISDAMYSDSEMIMDCLSELLDTLLRRFVEDVNVLEGMQIVSSLFNNGGSNTNFDNASSSLQSLEHTLTGEMIEKMTILGELVSAIGLQRFRFDDRIANGKFTQVYRNELG